jgi:septum formation protein
MDVDETPLAGESPQLMVDRLAAAKALAVHAPPGAIVLGCDTTVAHGGVPLGKPRDAADAKRMLLSLSGKQHLVITGYCLAGSDGVLVADAATTRVRMCAFDATAAEGYVATGEPFGKAGAYAIQGRGGRLVDSIEGSYTNVMGLPLDDVLPLIARYAPDAIEVRG